MAGSLSFSNVFTPATAAQWLSTILSIGSTVGLNVSSWQPGGIARSILSITSSMMSLEDVGISLASQGGFLDFAATGTVVYTNPLTGQTTTAYVTPDPSIPAQFPVAGVVPQPGWLDILADSVYNCQRIQPTFAPGILYFANTSGTPSTAYGAGTYHVANPTTAATYSNTASLAIAASTTIGPGVTGASNAPNIVITDVGHGLATGAVVYITGVLGNTAANGFWQITVTGANTFSLNGSAGNGAWTSGGTVYTTQAANFQADVYGTGSNAAVGSITSPVTALVGVFCSNLLAFTGANFESNVALVARCRLKQQSLSPNGAAAAYAYFALTASQLLDGQILGGVAQAATSSLLSAPITQALVTSNTVTGSVTTTIANASGPVSGVVGLAVTAATNASPIQITVGSTTGLSNGNTVEVIGVQGNTAANGFWVIANLTGTTFTLTGSTGNGTYTSGGTVEGGDLGLVDGVIQANCVPTAVTALTQSATALNVNVVATVNVPVAQGGTAVATIQTALTNYFATVPIGGFVKGVSVADTLPFNAVLGVIENALGPLGSPGAVRSATMTLNGGTVDLAVTQFQVPVLSPTPTINVQTF